MSNLEVYKGVHVHPPLQNTLHDQPLVEREKRDITTNLEPSTSGGGVHVHLCTPLTEWYRGLTCDHLYDNCRNLTQAEAELRRVGWWDVGRADRPAWASTIDPHGGDVCGMCLHRHNRATHKAAP